MIKRAAVLEQTGRGAGTGRSLNGSSKLVTQGIEAKGVVFPSQREGKPLVSFEQKRTQLDFRWRAGPCWSMENRQ